MQSTRVPLVWTQTSVFGVDEPLTLTVELETPTLSVTRMVVFVMVELEVKVGAVIAMTGAVVSMT